jgi:hypothetical protein
MKLRSKAEATPAADALAALLAKIAEITGRRNACQAELRRLDIAGHFIPEVTAKLRREARELLNGAVDGLLPPPQPTAGEQIRVLRHDIEVANAALEETEKLVGRLQSEAALERMRLRAGDIRATMGGIADAVLALESALQRRDALLKELKPSPDFIPGAGWAFLGRIGRSESQSYRFLQAAVAAGWLSEEKFTAAVKQSRASLI